MSATVIPDLATCHRVINGMYGTNASSSQVTHTFHTFHTFDIPSRQIMEGQARCQISDSKTNNLRGELMPIHFAEDLEPNDLVDALYRLPHGRYVLLVITGPSGRTWLSQHQKLALSTYDVPRLRLDGADEDIYVYQPYCVPYEPDPEEEFALAQGVMLTGIEVGRFPNCRRAWESRRCGARMGSEGFLSHHERQRDTEKTHTRLD